MFAISDLPLTSLPHIYISSGVFVILAFFIRSISPLDGSFATKLLEFNSRFYAGCSILLGLLVSASVLGERKDDLDMMARYLYHISKQYEYLDIFLVTAVGGLVGIHFALHHLTVSWSPSLLLMTMRQFTNTRLLTTPTIAFFSIPLLQGYPGRYSLFSIVSTTQ